MNLELLFSPSKGRLAALALAVLAAPVAMASDNNTGTIMVTGTVVDNTCELDKTDTKVTLDKVSAVSLMNAKKTDVAAKDFTIGLKNCGAHASNVDITVSGTGDTKNTGAFKNEATDNPAEGVAMDFYSLNGTTPKQMKPGDTATQPLTANAASELNFRVAYVGTEDSITAGSFKSVVKFTLNYK
ncbi:fimbrial protein [Enterobacter hormaechei]